MFMSLICFTLFLCHRRFWISWFITCIWIYLGQNFVEQMPPVMYPEEKKNIHIVFIRKLFVRLRTLYKQFKYLFYAVRKLLSFHLFSCCFVPFSTIPIFSSVFINRTTSSPYISTKRTRHFHVIPTNACNSTITFRCSL